MDSDKKTVEIHYQSQVYKLPTVEVTDGDKAIDISNLKKETGLITYDPGYQNTSAYLSSISFVDGDKGILQYRGIPIQELAEKTTFIQTAYLLIYGHLPKQDELRTFSYLLNKYSLLHEDMINIFRTLPQNAHPMATLSMMVNALSIYNTKKSQIEAESCTPKAFDITVARLISSIRTIAAFAYKKQSSNHLCIHKKS